MGTLPNLIIIGAAKCGTTSLHYYLSLHPEIQMSRIKELNFFIRERNWDRGLDWYKSNFGSARIRGEASPKYSSYPEFDGVAERMNGAVPEAKLIYMVRDPIQRMISQYLHAYALGVEDKSITEALANKDSLYICRSRYYMQIERYLAYYDPAQILILEQEALWQQREETLSEVFRFLGVDASFRSPAFRRIKNETSIKRRANATGQKIRKLLLPLRDLEPRLYWFVERYLTAPFSKPVGRPFLPEELRKRLADDVRDDVERLAAFARKDFGHWHLDVGEQG